MEKDNEEFIRGYEMGASDVLDALEEDLTLTLGPEVAKVLVESLARRMGLTPIEDQYGMTEKGTELATILRSEAVMAGVNLDDKMALAEWLLNEAPKISSVMDFEVKPELFIPLMIAYEESLLRGPG